MATSSASSRWSFKKPSVVSGFGLTLGLSLTYLLLIVLIPLAGAIFRAFSLGTEEFWRIATDVRTAHALQLSFYTALFAAILNACFGLAVAWVLTRYRFPFRRLLDAVVDLPFALPTAVAGIALTAIYARNGWIGQFLEPLGIKIAFTPAGVTVALVFIGLPFIVRTLQPVIEDLDIEIEEASASLGATRLQTFWRVILPTLLPALLTGFALALARAVGEYGSVIFIAGNIPYVSEIAPLLIVIRLEEYDYEGATVVASAMLFISFGMLLLINVIQAWARRRFGSA